MKKIAAAAALVGALTLGVAMQANAQQHTGGTTTQHSMHSTTTAAATHPAAATHTAATPAPAHKAAAAAHHSRVAESAARKTALDAVAHGRVSSHTLTREHGRPVYVYMISVPGQTGHERVAVDAETGRIMSQAHQAPAAARHSAASAHHHK